MTELILTILATMLVFSILGIAFYIKSRPKTRHPEKRCPVCEEGVCIGIKGKR